MSVLPELPKQYKKREAEFGLLLKKHLKKYPMKQSGPMELKQTTTDSIPFSDVTNKQIAKLREAKTSTGSFDKFPDDSRGYKPWDYAYYRNAPALIVIRFPQEFHFIDVDAFMQERKQSDRESLTVEKSRRIAIRCVKIRV